MEDTIEEFIELVYYARTHGDIEAIMDQAEEELSESDYNDLLELLQPGEYK